MDSSSILAQPAAIATLANEHALQDLDILFYSLSLWNKSPPPIYLFCTETVQKKVANKYKGQLFVKTVLEPYKTMTRKEMEIAPSRKGLPNLFYDFTQEKCDLMKWTLQCLSEEDRKRGVLFCDADICWLGPMPLVDTTLSLGLSPHMIRKNDQYKFGIYNAGFLWMNDLTLPDLWRKACETSHFFEQAALEKLVTFNGTFFFGSIFNYGWWRMYQSENTVDEQKSKWSIKRDPKETHSGLLVNSYPLACIHTHFQTDDSITKEFNKWILSKLTLLKSQKKVAQLLLKLSRIN